MSQPLGDAVGNALEVAAAIEVLQGAGSMRLRDVSLALAAGTLELLGRGGDQALEEVTALLDGGAALERFGDLVVAQGGDRRVIEAPRDVLPVAPVIRDWAPASGIVHAIACRRIGEIAGMLGAGRQRAADVIDPAVGLEIHVRVGDVVAADGRCAGRPAVRIHAADETSADHAAEALAQAVVTGRAAADIVPLVHRRIGFDDRP